MALIIQNIRKLFIQKVNNILLWLQHRNIGKKYFYVYDSAIPQKLYAKEIPIGNIERSYQEILRDWKGTFYPWPWKYCYLVVKKI